MCDGGTYVAKFALLATFGVLDIERSESVLTLFVAEQSVEYLFFHVVLLQDHNQDQARYSLHQKTS